MALKLAGGIIALLAVLFQFVVKDILFTTLGYGRDLQSIDEFPYSCRRIYHPLLDSCEDLWLDDSGRRLYAACSAISSRKHWNPAADKLNTSGRGLTDHISVLNIDEPGPEKLYGVHELQLTGPYASATGGREIDLHGFDVQVLDNDEGRLRFFVINHRPVSAISSSPVDARQHGANSTVEVFDLVRGETELRFVRTISDPAIQTPNRPASTGDGGFVVTNDHSAKVGFRRELDLLLGGGSIAYCSATSKCHIASNSGFNFPNGIVRGADGLYYTPSAMTGEVSIHRLSTNRTLTKVGEIYLGMPLDNLSVDAEGDIFAAGFPKAQKMLKAMGTPETIGVPTTVWRVRRKGGEGLGFEVVKVLEDRECSVLPGTTSVVHDARKDVFWLGGPTSNFISVCERRG
ncbi:serum paraoxonase/arylesterase-like protein [Talaromyces proteolyticus]|uniref:Serum paraoxonase/arylesterase-like protein n=1 Tax=Talaromyces proteolyticus TaxID=1131652 RepID=A0AAD4L382_9EURO|nr:serum paraoxonase/arylesterase-like protein [Talaromyces proteolyticus]KAH8703393.1 serum paraoxonase/arylesterase-like protein [Talaromyces proteolyticus]